MEPSIAMAKENIEAPTLPWKHMARMHDKLIHEYFGVDLSIVRAVVKDDLPPLRPAIERLLAKQEDPDACRS